MCQWKLLFAIRASKADKGCPTCRVKVPKQKTVVSVAAEESGATEAVEDVETQEGETDALEEEAGDDGDGDEESYADDYDRTLDDYHQIENSRGEFLRLDMYVKKCIPNLPKDLTCPVCRVTDRRTLQLTEVTYQSKAGTEQRHPWLMPLSLTPREEHGEVSSPVSKRAKVEAEPPTDRCFLSAPLPRTVHSL